MIETGIVQEITGNTLTLIKENNIACFGCMSQECKEKAISFTAEKPTAMAVEPGQRVETETASSALKQGLGALIPPILGFIAGFLLTGALFPTAGDPPRAAGGALLLFAVAVSCYFYRRRFPLEAKRRVIRALG
ncbi:hypothetical protein TREPR_2764 [Treponema primitia ZAS-2]|uniref:Positive regulator of sigma E, RseC/MucC n=1 Tax=Treponema primitia (strain ATCC BAA-887 / DSM 12427 / ZAS-2) TaxID=545694 RepID=F5YQH3_TREPZ|nr:SoxR reducing system RseC family protein [Treponema primitia]AEF86039.1 hypothetical protein TREPR_2764 [Treponema primitia ZAS-2]